MHLLCNLNRHLILLGLPAVITFAVHANGLYDEVPVGEACRRLEEAGAAVVGVNCTRGPHTMLPLLKEIRKACKVNIDSTFVM